jgi:predicted 3-demethylubiquinone-9 3-methyltransferase (glyoxalase superfamily)
MTTTINTFLTYDTQAEEAAKLYTSLFDGRITQTMRTPEGGPNPGSVLTVTFELLGQTYIALNGGPSFKFSQAFSMMVQVDTQAEIDRLWKALIENGGKEVQCGWLTDKFGMSWQICPRQLLAMISDKDKAKAGRAMQAMMKMTKLDLPKLQAAFNGA